MISVNFHELGSIPDEQLIFAVICTIHDNMWIWCKNIKRNAWEIPGGKREAGENIEQAAKRELYEETGANEFSLKPICEYSVTKNGVRTFARLFFAETKKFDAIPSINEIAEIKGFFDLPEPLSFPQIQPLLIKKASEWAKEQGIHKS